MTPFSYGFRRVVQDVILRPYQEDQEVEARPTPLRPVRVIDSSQITTPLQDLTQEIDLLLKVGRAERVNLRG